MSEEKEKKKEYTREEYVYLSKLYEKAQRYEDMISSINKFIELNPQSPIPNPQSPKYLKNYIFINYLLIKIIKIILKNYL